jgi:lipopolysaccharide export LptBFGC system permease protein LptF
MKRFDRYFFWVFVQSFVIVTALFTSIFIVVDVLLNLDKIQSFPNIATGTALFYAYNTPPVLYLLYPLMIFAAGMFSVARLMRSRELLLLEACGVSRKRALAAIMIPVLLLGVIGLGLRETAMPALAQEARQSTYGAFELRSGRRVSVRDDDGNMWFVRRYDLATRTLEDVRIMSADGNLILSAPELTWSDEIGGWWAPMPAELHDLRALVDPDALDSGPVDHEGALPFGNLMPADFARRRRGYNDRPLSDLWRDAAINRNDRELSVALWHEIWYPLTGFILLSCGIGLVLRRTGGGVFINGSLALATVVGFFIVNFWFETLAQAGAFPGVVGASVAPVMFTIFGIFLFPKI